MRLHKPIVAISAVALLALAACGGGSSNSGGPPGVPSSSNAAPAAGQGKNPNAQAPAADVAGAQKGGTVHVLYDLGLTTMDPTEAYYLNTSNILSGLVTRSLTQYIYDAKTKDMVLIPDLATDLGTPNSDFTQWTFTIRKGVKWENGTEVTPQDVAYGIERSFDAETFPGGAGPVYSKRYFLDGQTYNGPYKSGTNYKGIVIKGQTLTLKMARPFPDMPYWGAFPAMGPIPTDKAINDPAKYALHPWSTGPYMFDKYVPEHSLTLVKNPNWDPNTDPARHQYVDGFDMTFDVELAKIDQILLQDQGDGQNTVSEENIASTDYLQFTQKAGDRLITGPQPCTFMWFPDYRKIPDLKVRQAIAWAYPYKDALAAAGEIEGVTAYSASNIMPPGIPGRTEYNQLPGHTPGSTDTAKAKQLLQQAGKLGFELKFAYRTDNPLSVAAKDAIVSSMTKAGFKATPVATTTADYSALIADPNADVNIRSLGWCSDWPTGLTWFPPLFQTTNLKSEGLGVNYSVFSEKSVDDQMNNILTQPLDKQPGLWNKLDQSLQKKYFPVVNLYYGGAALMRGSKVNGVVNDATSGLPYWKDIWLTQ